MAGSAMANSSTSGRCPLRALSWAMVSSRLSRVVAAWRRLCCRPSVPKKRQHQKSVISTGKAQVHCLRLAVIGWFTTVAAGWVSTLLLESRRKQCNHPAQELTCAAKQPARARDRPARWWLPAPAARSRGTARPHPNGRATRGG